MTSKRCLKCRVLKNISEFWPRGRNRIGRHSWCKACQRVYSQARNQNQNKQARQTPAADADPNASRYKDHQGYVLIKHGPGWVYEHRLVMNVLNRPNLHVHHINGNKADNRPENLQIMTQSEHQRLTRLALSQARLREDGKVLCSKCKQYKSPVNFFVDSRSSIGLQCYCKACHQGGNEVERNKISAMSVFDGLCPELINYIKQGA